MLPCEKVNAPQVCHAIFILKHVTHGGKYYVKGRYALARLREHPTILIKDDRRPCLQTAQLGHYQDRDEAETSYYTIETYLNLLTSKQCHAKTHDHPDNPDHLGHNPQTTLRRQIQSDR